MTRPRFVWYFAVDWDHWHWPWCHRLRDPEDNPVPGTIDCGIGPFSLFRIDHETH